MKIHLFILFILITIMSVANNTTLIDSANSKYQQGMYDDALVLYDSVLSNGFESSEIYYNLGNAYYKTNNLAYAILNYERAHLLAPGDDDVKFNLNLANTHVVDDIKTIDEMLIVKYLSNISNMFSSDTWAIISLSLFVAFLILLVFYFFIKILAIKKLSFFIGLVLFVISISSFVISRNQKTNLVRHNQAIVITSTITAKSSPDKSGTDIFVIHEGLKVRLEQALGEWIEIKLSNGHKGWIKASDVELI